MPEQLDFLLNQYLNNWKQYKKSHDITDYKIMIQSWINYYTAFNQYIER